METNDEDAKVLVSMAKDMAVRMNYDQIIVIGRRVEREADAGGEMVTTYGRNEIQAKAAHKIGEFLKFRVMGWSRKR